MKLSQVASVVTFTKQILGDAWTEGTDVKSVVTKDQVNEIANLIADGMTSDEVDLSSEAKAKFDTRVKLVTYVKGMINNHYRKSKLLNGGSEYEIKNPGSRSGSVELKQALSLKAKIIADGKEIPESLEIFIANEQAKVVVKTTKELDLSSLPEELRNLA